MVQKLKTLLSVLHDTGIPPERVLHLTVKEHFVTNTDLSNEYFELPHQHSKPFPPKLLGYFDSLSFRSVNRGLVLH